MPRKQPDPIFAAIETHQKAHNEFSGEAYYLWSKHCTRLYSTHAAAWKAVRKNYEAATEKLVATEVQTLDGARVFSTYLASLQCCGQSEIAPGLYSIEVWDLSAGMDRISECLARHSRPRSKASTPRQHSQHMLSGVAA